MGAAERFRDYIVDDIEPRKMFGGKTQSVCCSGRKPKAAPEIAKEQTMQTAAAKPST
mgnify:CR=1 FL=1